jgi:RimJ/RimL family protein N-acetyltransferase
MSNVSIPKYPLEVPATRQYGVPRQFGIGPLMILTAVFALLLSLLKAAGAGPPVLTLFAIMFFGVGVGQFVLFRGQQPRMASVVAGAIVFPLGLVAVAVSMGNYWSVGGLLCCIPGGAMIGYATGAFIGGVFLVLSWFSGEREIAPTLALRSMAAEHVSIVAGWGETQPLGDCWTLAGTVAADADALAERVASMGQNATLQTLELIDIENGEPQGYAEIAEIDPVHRRGQLRLAIVDPAAPDRGWLSATLLHAVMRYAFLHLDLHRLGVYALYGDNWSCYTVTGFIHEGELRDWVRGKEGYHLVHVLSILRGAWNELPRGSPEARAITLPPQPSEHAEPFAPAAASSESGEPGPVQS